MSPIAGPTSEVSMLVTRPAGVRRRLTAVAAAVAMLALVLAPASSEAGIPASAFPSKAVVKAVLHGTGHWRSYPAHIETLGSKPRGCRSDKQMLDYDAVRARSYYGREKGMPRSIYSGAEIAVLRYADRASASAAVERNGTYPARCPKVVEWVCTECDGIYTTWRTLAPAAQVGSQSVVWRYRQYGNLKSDGWAVVARSGATVVRVTVSRTRDIFVGGPYSYPPLMKKHVAVRLARIALRTATP